MHLMCEQRLLAQDQIGPPVGKQLARLYLNANGSKRLSQNVTHSSESPPEITLYQNVNGGLQPACEMACIIAVALQRSVNLLRHVSITISHFTVHSSVRRLAIIFILSQAELFQTSTGY